MEKWHLFFCDAVMIQPEMVGGRLATVTACQRHLVCWRRRLYTGLLINYIQLLTSFIARLSFFMFSITISSQCTDTKWWFWLIFFCLFPLLFPHAFPLSFHHGLGFSKDRLLESSLLGRPGTHPNVFCGEGSGHVERPQPGTSAKFFAGKVAWYHWKRAKWNKDRAAAFLYTSI